MELIEDLDAQVHTAIQLIGKLDVTVLRSALTQIAPPDASAHVALGVTASSPPLLTLLDLTGKSNSAQLDEIRSLEATSVGKALNLRNGPLLTGTLARMDDNHHVLLLAADQLAYASLSASALLQKLINAYDASAPEGSLRRPPVSPALKASVQSRRLPICIQREITSYLFYSLPLCVILADERLHPWYYERFVQVTTARYESRSGHNKLAAFFMDGYSLPEVLDANFIENDLVSRCGDPVSFVCGCIDSGQYVITVLDEYYLANKESSDVRHFAHESLIYGYDSVNSVLFAVGFDRSRRLSKLEFSYRSFTKAFESAIQLRSSAKQDFPSATQVLTRRHLKRSLQYPFSIDRFAMELKSYIDSSVENQDLFQFGSLTDRFSRMGEEGVSVQFGFDAYQAYISYFDELKSGSMRMDFRIAHLFFEQKRCILNRLNYIHQRYRLDKEMNEMIDEYEKSVVSELQSVRLWLLRYRLTHGSVIPETTIDKIIPRLTVAARREATVLNKILRKLRALLE